ncbi:hypothetical protein [Mesorhizobium sp. M0047]|uniref:hypothetical protein n=1 Tax=Mesorhizobium sp. M0047 TaxID=2956859 RepID=UPI0033365C65
MARGIKDEVAIMATCGGGSRRIGSASRSQPNAYNFRHSIIDPTTKVKKGQPIELIGDVTRIDEDN